MEVPKIRHDIENNFDIAFQVFSAQISDDYLAILKTKVHPIYSHLAIIFGDKGPSKNHKQIRTRTSRRVILSK